jgi:hypothetical protein
MIPEALLEAEKNAGRLRDRSSLFLREESVFAPHGGPLD